MINLFLVGHHQLVKRLTNLSTIILLKLVGFSVECVASRESLQNLKIKLESCTMSWCNYAIHLNKSRLHSSLPVTINQAMFPVEEQLIIRGNSTFFMMSFITPT